MTMVSLSYMGDGKFFTSRVNTFIVFISSILILEKTFYLDFSICNFYFTSVPSYIIESVSSLHYKGTNSLLIYWIYYLLDSERYD